MRAEDLTRIMGELPVEEAFLGGGGNSQVNKFVLASGRVIAVKSYYPQCADWRERMDAEFGAYILLHRNQINCVPRPVAVDELSRSAVFSFEDGRKIKADEAGSNEFGCFAAFAARLQDLSMQHKLADYRPAKAHCLWADAIEDQIRARLEKLETVEITDHASKEMLLFLEQQLRPFYAEICCWRSKELQKAGKDNYALKLGEWTLSPSDFGLHNALVREDGSFVFLDFEYFGRDDPAKMVADFMLHPAMGLSSEGRRAACRLFLKKFDSDFFRLRLRTLLPLVGIKWCTIFLNEFFHHGMARRVYASGKTGDIASVRRIQLDKAVYMLKAMKKEYEGYPDGIIAG